MDNPTDAPLSSPSTTGGPRDAMARAFGGARLHDAEKEEAHYPIGTLAYYGPTNRLATKIVASIVRGPHAKPDPLHRWITQAGDIRDDRVIGEQVAAFLRRHLVKQIAHPHRIIGCPHEEGKDYPEGGQCPHCPYWQGRERFAPESPDEDGMSAAEILAELSKPNPTRPPLEALSSADHQREELIEPLLRAVEKGIDDRKGTPPGDGLLFSYAVYLLAKWREQRAFPLFIRWLSLPERGALEIDGDTVTQDGRRLLASVCGGDLEPLKQLIQNRQANGSCRFEAIQALGVLVAWKELPHQVATDYFLWLARTGLERERSFVWDGLAITCVDIEAIDVFPDLRRAYEEGLASPGVMEPEEMDQVETSPRGQQLATFRDQNPPIEDVGKETSWWQCFKHDLIRTIVSDAEDEQARSQQNPQPIGAGPKVGRNDPCPCGSGKKFKKCCGK